MKLVPNRNFIMLLAAILVVAFGFMSLYLNQKVVKQQNTNTYNEELKQIGVQSDSIEVEDIETDLELTDLSDLDKELENIQKEIDETSF